MLPGMTAELHIPDTVTGCQTLITELAKTVTEGEQKIASLQQQIETLQLEMAELLRRAFQKRERTSATWGVARRVGRGQRRVGAFNREAGLAEGLRCEAAG